MPAPSLPPLPEPFAPAFRELLPALLSTRGRFDAARAERLRTRRAALSQSGTFVGHRHYEPGDDLRRLDWAAYARTGELFTKQLQEEDRRSVTVVVDLSASLMAGTPPRRVGALRLAAVLSGLALMRLDGVSVVAAGHAPACARFVGIGQLPQLLQFLRELPVTAAAPRDVVAPALQADALGRVHWISDFAPPQDFARPLASLRRRGARITGWLPTLPDDELPRAGGYLLVADPETGQELRVPVDRALRDELRRQLAALERRQRRLFGEAGAVLHRWPVSSLEQPRLAEHLPIVAAVQR